MSYFQLSKLQKANTIRDYLWHTHQNIIALTKPITSHRVVIASISQPMPGIPSFAATNPWPYVNADEAKPALKSYIVTPANLQIVFHRPCEEDLHMAPQQKGCTSH